MHSEQSPHTHGHFKGKDAIEHVAEAQVEGLISSIEIHGTETPGHISAGADAARETALLLLLLGTLLTFMPLSATQIFLGLTIFAFTLLIWKTGRSAWLGWARLERLHRVLAQENWEIEHNRPQERDELRVLYAAKGFEGRLLEDVLDVLMADGDRLLKVMVEEELGLSLQSHDHPLKQAFGAAIGSFISATICLLALFFYSFPGLICAAFLVLALGAALSAQQARNRMIPAIVWNLGLGILAFGSVYFLSEFAKLSL